MDLIRIIEKSDAEAVAAICRTALNHEAAAELLERRIGELAADPTYYIAVYADLEGVKGFIQAERYDLLYGENGWNIIALAVAPQHQRQGIGKALLRSLEAHASQRGGGIIRLNSRVERADAHAFYERCGYVNDKVQKRFIRRL